MEKMKNTGNLIVVFILQICGILILPIWFIFAAMSFMAFDSGYSFEAMIFVTATWAYSVVFLIFSIVAWVFYRKEKYKSSKIIMSIPLIYALLYILIFLIFAEM